MAPRYAYGIALSLALLIVCALLVAPIWMVEYPPLLDYPNHLAGAFVLAHLNDPSFPFNQSYAAHWGPYPYLAMDLTLVGLQRLVPAALAGRLFLSLCVLAAPLAAWFFLRQANPSNDPMALWSLLAAYNLFFLWGFLNMELSLGVWMLALGLWLHYLARPRAGSWLLLLVVVTGVYFTHLLAFGLAAFIVTVYSFLARRRVHETLLTWLAFAPGTCMHFLSRVAAGKSWQVEFRPMSEKLSDLSAFMQGYSFRLDQITLLALAGSCVVAWWRNPEFRWNHPWPFLAAGLFGLYWVFPQSYGVGSDADVRLLPFVFLLLPVVASVGRRGRVLGAIALLLFIARTANVAYNFVAAQRELVGLARSFESTSPNALVLPIVEAKNDEPERRPYAHFWAYGIIERGWFSPYLFAEKGLHALQIRRDTYSPDGFWDLSYDQPPDWAQIQEDYDYVWAYHVRRFSSELTRIGQLVYEDADLQVFQMNKSSNDSSAAGPREGHELSKARPAPTNRGSR